MRRTYEKYKDIAAYAFAAAALLVFLRMAEMRLLLFYDAFEWYALLIAAVFTGIGVWLALRFSKPKSETENFPLEFPRNEKLMQAHNISARELDVLELMAAGNSNAEIAARLFVSANTVKTHVSRIYGKLDVQRRTQAVDRARQIGLIA